MKRLLISLLLVPALAWANEPLNMTATVQTAFGSISASYVEKLSEKSFLEIDVVNTSDCVVEVRLDDATGAPQTVVPAGTTETLSFGRLEGFIKTTVSLRYLSGETCTSGAVFIKGIY